MKTGPLVVLAAAVGLTGCGGHSGNVGVRWARAVDAENWSAACAVMASAPHCADALRRDYAGQRARLLRAGAYQQGDKVTDNRTRFAITVNGSKGRSTTYYEVQRHGGRQVVVLDVSVVGS